MMIMMSPTPWPPPHAGISASNNIILWEGELIGLAPITRGLHPGLLSYHPIRGEKSIMQVVENSPERQLIFSPIRGVKIVARVVRPGSRKET
jgi:hypothetical protein